MTLSHFMAEAEGEGPSPVLVKENSSKGGHAKVISYPSAGSAGVVSTHRKKNRNKTSSFNFTLNYYGKGWPEQIRLPVLTLEMSSCLLPFAFFLLPIVLPDKNEFLWPMTVPTVPVRVLPISITDFTSLLNPRLLIVFVELFADDTQGFWVNFDLWHRWKCDRTEILK